MTKLILPPLRRTSRDAETFAKVVHAGQVDKAGRPYVEHLAGVARRAGLKIAGMPGILTPTSADEVVQIAWLHDAIEDQRTTGDDLLREGFSMGVVEGVRWLTKLEGRSYAEWIDEIAVHAPLAPILAKISDLEDNSDPVRLALLPEAQAGRLRAKYAPAHQRLVAAATARGWRPTPLATGPEQGTPTEARGAP